MLHLRKVSGERLAISSVIFILVILEFVSGVQRPKWLGGRNKIRSGSSNLLKVGGSGAGQSATYNEAFQNSMLTDQDVTNFGVQAVGGVDRQHTRE